MLSSVIPSYNDEKEEEQQQQSTEIPPDLNEKKMGFGAFLNTMKKIKNG